MKKMIGLMLFFVFSLLYSPLLFSQSVWFSGFVGEDSLFASFIFNDDFSLTCKLLQEGVPRVYEGSITTDQFYLTSEDGSVFSGKFSTDYTTSVIGNIEDTEENRAVLLSAFGGIAVQEMNSPFCYSHQEIPFFYHTDDSSLNLFLTQKSTMAVNEFLDSFLGSEYLFRLDRKNEYCSSLSIKGKGKHAVSFVITQYEYTGGAHGNTYYQGCTAFFIEGEWIDYSLVDLFSREELDDLSLSVQSELTLLGASSPQEAIFSYESVYKPAFSLSSDKITFFFGPYDAGCYAEGCYEVSLPLQDLSFSEETAVLAEKLETFFF